VAAVFVNGVTPETELPHLAENALQIAWDFLEGSGQVNDPQETAEVLLSTIAAFILKGERRTLMLSNRAINAYRQHQQAFAA
jgi:hypothetical protein